MANSSENFPKFTYDFPAGNVCNDCGELSIHRCIDQNQNIPCWNCKLDEYTNWRYINDFMLWINEYDKNNK
jgi:hypothetical protein